MDGDTGPAIERVNAACEVLDWLGKRATALPQSKTMTVAMGFQLLIARAYLHWFAQHLASGIDPYDALLLAAANNDDEFTLQQQGRARALAMLLEGVKLRGGS